MNDEKNENKFKKSKKNKMTQKKELYELKQKINTFLSRNSKFIKLYKKK